MKSNNTSGFTGVSWHKIYQKWSAQIKVAGKKIFLSSFTKKEDAIIARTQANLKYGYHASHGTANQFAA